MSEAASPSGRAARLRRARRVHRLLAALLYALSLAHPFGALASVTQFWTLRAPADYREAELSGAAVDPDGSVRLGVETVAADLPGADVPWAVLAREGEALAGTGPEGMVYRVRPGGGVEPLDSTRSGQILCLARGPDGTVYAGTAPDGRVLRLAGRRFETYFETGDKYVWSLAWSGGTLFAVTGPDGKLFAIHGRDKGDVVFRAPSGPLTALAPDGSGGVFVGSSGRGTIYWHGKERTRALYQASETEIRSLVFLRGALYAAALSVPPVQVESATDRPEHVQPASPSDARSVIYRIVPDSSVAVWWRSSQGLVFALAPREDGGLWVGTGSRAALYALDQRGRAEVLYAAAAGNVTALSADAGGVWMATSGPARLYRVRAPSGRGEARSPVLDAGRLARWGRFLSLGDLRNVRFSTRSGNTALPDSTWSEWRDVEPGASVLSPSARYLQWQARLSGPASVREVRVAYSEVNEAPHIEEFTIYPEPGKFYSGEITPRQDPVTQVLPGGQKVQYSMPSPPAGAPDVLPSWARGLRPMSWRAGDPNADPLQYRLDYRRDGTPSWTELVDGVDTPPYTWDTNGLPEGQYEVRLTATDRPRQGDEAMSDEVTSGPVVIDHTPPSLSGLSVREVDREVVVSGEGSDGGLYVSKVEVEVGDGEWQLATPEDGLWDGPRERFTARVHDVAPGSYEVRVRLADAVGNVSVFTDRVTVRP